MIKEDLVKLIKASKGEDKCDLVIKNTNVIDVYSRSIIKGDIGIKDGIIVGIGSYDGEREIDGEGKFASPGFIDCHLHIESAHISPEEMGKIVAPHGTTTIIADPHEIVNVAGIDGMKYMLEAGKNSGISIKYMVPSCVPATQFEHSGAVINAEDMVDIIDDEDILGLGEYMNYPGLLNCSDTDMDKIVLARNKGKLIDGHSPGLKGVDLNAYTICGIGNDHEASSLEEMNDRISRGMYVLMREGSACHDLPILAKGINEKNYRRVCFCTDDRQANTIFEKGHLEEHLRICRDFGIDPIMSIVIATLNGAECFRLTDRGALAPGKRADIVLLNNLEDFTISSVFVNGKMVAKDYKYLGENKKADISKIKGSINVKDFTKDRLSLNAKSKKLNVIEICPGGILTKKSVEEVNLDRNGDFIFNKEVDIAKVSVIERHHNTGHMSVGLLKGYGIKEGAIAVSIAHDSHNIIVVGVNNEEIYQAVEELKNQGGGIVLVKEGEVLCRVPLVIGGLMSDKDSKTVVKELEKVDEAAFNELKINKEVDPVTTLSFMALPVIPEIKMTDMGLFDVTKFEFINIEA